MSSLFPWLAYQEDDDSSSDELGGGDGSWALDDSLDQGSPSANVKLLLSKSLKLQNDWYRCRRREDDDYDDDMLEFQYLRLLNKNKNYTSTPTSGKKRRRRRSPRTCKRLRPDTIMVPSHEEGVDSHKVSTDPKKLSLVYSLRCGASARQPPLSRPVSFSLPCSVHRVQEPSC